MRLKIEPKIQVIFELRTIADDPTLFADVCPPEQRRLVRVEPTAQRNSTVQKPCQGAAQEAARRLHCALCISDPTASLFLGNSRRLTNVIKTPSGSPPVLPRTYVHWHAQHRGVWICVSSQAYASGKSWCAYAKREEWQLRSCGLSAFVRTGRRLNPG